MGGRAPLGALAGLLPADSLEGKGAVDDRAGRPSVLFVDDALLLDDVSATRIRPLTSLLLRLGPSQRRRRVEVEQFGDNSGGHSCCETDHGGLAAGSCPLRQRWAACRSQNRALLLHK